MPITFTRDDGTTYVYGHSFRSDPTVTPDRVMLEFIDKQRKTADFQEMADRLDAAAERAGDVSVKDL